MSQPHKILFVCSGNICRSPMAEGIAPYLGDRLGVWVEARSAGTLGIQGEPAARNAVRACQQVGVDISGHVSQGVTELLLDWADVVLTMELRHNLFVREKFPRHAEKAILLGPFGGQHEIDDPVGRWIFAFRRSRKELEKCLEGYLRRL